MSLARNSQYRSVVLAAAFACSVLGGLARAQTTVTVAQSTEDRWHYPFNFTPGTRNNGSLFTASNAPEFDYRDAMIFMRFDFETTDTLSAAYVPPGLPPEQYTFDSFQIVLNHRAGDFSWDTREPQPNGIGQHFRIEAFGMGSNTVDLATWDETSAYEGQGFAPQERNPHPISTNADVAAEPNVTNAPGAAAWGLGEPVYGTAVGEYTPGTTSAAPFPVTFTFDLDQPNVRKYIQQGMSQGYLLICFSAHADPSGMSLGTNIPIFELNGFSPNPNARHEVIVGDFAITSGVADWQLY